MVVFGHPTLSRPVSRLLARDDVEVWTAEPTGLGLAGRTRRPRGTFARVEAAAADTTDWFERWRDADARVGRDLDALLAAEPDLTPYDVAGAVARALPPESLLVVGASSPIRDLDLMVPRYRGRRAPQGDRQPRPVRHRRRRLDGDRRRARPHAPTAAWPCSAT